MKPRFSILLLVLVTLALAAAVLAGAAAPEGAVPAKPLEAAAKPPEVRLMLDLADGSRVIGEPKSDGLDVHTTFGDTRLKWATIRVIDFKPGGEGARMDLANGDKLVGRMSIEKFELTTLVGPAMIPIGMVRSLIVTAAGNGAFSLKFDGHQNYVEVPNDPALDPAEAMTLECWYKTGEQVQTNILGKRLWRPNGTDQGYEFAIVEEGRIEGYWAGALPRGAKVNDGRWHHAALTWDGRTQRLFDDGRLAGQAVTGPWTPAPTAFRIGGVDGQPGQAFFFPGLITQVRLSKTDRYGGKNFTPELRFAPDENTIALWDFSEGAGAVLRDRSGHGHDGKLVGSPPPVWEKDVPTGVPPAAPPGPPQVPPVPPPFIDFD
jgi:hypothetical protein